MRMRIFLAVTILALGQAGTASADDLEAVGVVTATQGTVMMQPATMKGLVPVGPDDQVGPLALFETQADSRGKVLYIDDTLLTLGEQSRLEVTEQTYRAGSDTRAFVAHLIRGSVRALIGRQFQGDNSVFEIHAGTTVATARGTYFVLWSEQKPPATGTNKDSSAAGRAPSGSEIEEEGRIGVANIGQSGNVAFTSAGATVLVLPGQFSMALPGSPPTMPVALNGGASSATAAIQGTALTENPRAESPRAALAAVGLAGESPRTLDTGPRVAKVGPLAGQAPAGHYMLPEWPWPVTPVTPPAVASGAVIPTTTLNLLIRLP
jgi:hypothetical protein